MLTPQDVIDTAPWPFNDFLVLMNYGQVVLPLLIVAIILVKNSRRRKTDKPVE